MAKALTSRAPLWNGRRMGTVCSYANHKKAGQEIRALGFNVAQSNDFKPLDRNVHSAYTNGGWHYAYNGTGGYDINWQHEGANTWVETMLIDLYVIPILRKYGVKGILHKPRNRTDHRTWCHADRGSYHDYTVRSWNASQKKRAASLIAKHRTGSSSTSTATGKLRVDGYWGPLTKKRWQQVLGTTVDGVISKPYSQMVAKIQQGLGLKVTGKWDRHLTLALQKRYGTTQDGKTSKPSQWVRKLQARLNKGTW